MRKSSDAAMLHRSFFPIYAQKAEANASAFPQLKLI